MMEPTEILTRVVYTSEPALGVAEFARVLAESGLGATRPLGDAPRLGQMLSSAGLLLTARLNAPGRPLVGVARGVTDGCWCCYVSELAVCASAQGLGVGKGLMAEARRQLGPQVSIFLNSMPDVVAFYERVGMARQPHAFSFQRAQ